MSTFRVSRETYDINNLLEKAFCDGYEYALEQREFNDSLKKIVGKLDKRGYNFIMTGRDIKKAAKADLAIEKRIHGGQDKINKLKFLVKSRNAVGTGSLQNNNKVEKNLTRLELEKKIYKKHKNLSPHSIALSHSLEK